MKLTYLGHACFQLEINGKFIVLDPFIRGNELAIKAGVDIDGVKADYILVSHGHSDHTGDLVYLAQKTGAMVISSWEICTWCEKQQISKVHPLNIGGRRKFDFGDVKMWYASHSNSLPDGTYGGIAAGFIIQAEGKTIYYAGDTALNLEMKLIGEQYRLDLAILPIGDNFTMGYEDASLAAKWMSCGEIVGMHYDTFGYIMIDHEQAKDHFRKHNQQLHLIEIGGSIDI